MHKVKCDFIVGPMSAKLILNINFDSVLALKCDPSYWYTKFINVAFLESMLVVAKNNFNGVTFDLDLAQDDILSYIHPYIANFVSAIAAYGANKEKTFNIIINISTDSESGIFDKLEIEFAYLINYLSRTRGIKFNLDVTLSSMNVEKFKVYGYMSTSRNSNNVSCRLTLIDCNFDLSIIEYIDEVELLGSHILLSSKNVLSFTDTTGINEFTGNHGADNNELLSYVVLGSMLTLKNLILDSIKCSEDKNFRFRGDLVYVIDHSTYSLRENEQIVFKLDEESSLLSVSSLLGLAAPFYGEYEMVYREGINVMYIPSQYVVTNLVTTLDIDYMNPTDNGNTEDLLVELSSLDNFRNAYKIEKIRNNLFRHYPILRINKARLDSLIKNCSESK